MVKTSTVDEMLEKVGSFGRYQWMLLFAYGYTMMTIIAFPILIVTFITAEPDWVCVQGYNNSATVCNVTGPITLTSDHYKARCDANMSREAWTFVKGFTSTVTEYDLVCAKSYLQIVAQSCYWAGMILGLLLAGYSSDRFGRRPTYFLGTIGTVLATWVMVFPKSFSIYIVCRVFIGISAGFLNASGFVLLTEYVGKKHRAWIGIGSFFFWVAAYPLLALMAYLLPEWRHLLLATAILATPCPLICWFLPESVRWLLLNDKFDEAKEQLVKVAKFNRKPFPDEELQKAEVVKTGNIFHLFSHRDATKRTLICWNIWFTVVFVYYGVSYGSVDLGWNMHLVFALSGLVELPSNFAAIYTGDRYGRKICTAIGFVVACLASIVSVSIPYDKTGKVNVSTVFRVLMSVLAKFSINLSFGLIYVWTVELFPTFMRGSAFSTSSLVSRLGSIVASFVIWLIRIHTMLPFGIMGLCCFQAAVFTFFLPETNGRPTMECMSDMVQKREVPLIENLPETTSDVCNNERNSDMKDQEDENQVLV